jgi:hypothetical protein
MTSLLWWSVGGSNSQAIAEHVEMKGGQHAIAFHPTTHPTTCCLSANNLLIQCINAPFQVFHFISFYSKGSRLLYESLLETILLCYRQEHNPTQLFSIFT